MAKPVILTVDDEPQVLRAVERDLRTRFGSDYRIIRAESGSQALDAVRELKKRNESIALFVADQRMAKDAFESYTQLGYEVQLEPLGESALQDECSECHLILRQFSVVYTRKLEKK